MNHSWSNSSNSPGFVYFDQTPTRNPADTTEFLSFANSTPTKSDHRFSPLNSSNYGTPQFQSSPRKFNKRNSFRYSGGNQGNSSFNRNNSNHSYNSNYNNSRSNHNHRHVNHNNSKSFSNEKLDVSYYYDHTCTLDPWADLQKELDKTRQEEVAKTLISAKSTVEMKQKENVLSSDEESDSEESEDSPAISSTAEEEMT